MPATRANRGHGAHSESRSSRDRLAWLPEVALIFEWRERLQSFDGLRRQPAMRAGQRPGTPTGFAARHGRRNGEKRMMAPDIPGVLQKSFSLPLLNDVMLPRAMGPPHPDRGIYSR